MLRSANWDIFMLPDSHFIELVKRELMEKHDLPEPLAAALAITAEQNMRNQAKQGTKAKRILEDQNN